jgi:hypothetical protein
MLKAGMPSICTAGFHAYFGNARIACCNGRAGRNSPGKEATIPGHTNSDFSELVDLHPHQVSHIGVAPAAQLLAQPPLPAAPMVGWLAD